MIIEMFDDNDKSVGNILNFPKGEKFVLPNNCTMIRIKEDV